MIKNFRTPLAVGAGIVALLVSGCGSDSTPDAADSTPEAVQRTEVDHASPRLVVTYEGGVKVLDAATLGEVGGTDASSRTTLAVAGDERHVFLVETDGGRVRVLDSGTWGHSHGDHSHYYVQSPGVGATFTGSEQGHVVSHRGQAAIFADGSGEIAVISESQLDESQPAVRTVAQPPHHGVAIPLSGNRILTSVPGEGEGKRIGIAILDDQGRETVRHAQCDAVHGEAHAGQGETFAFGCSDGVLIYDDITGQVRKAASPVPNGRVSTLVGSADSPVLLGNYTVPNDERASQFVTLTDSATGTVRLVDVGAQYHGLARGPKGEAFVLAADGRLHVIDPNTGEITRRIDVLAPWTKPADYTVPRPELAVAGDAVYVTDPATSSIVRVDVETGTAAAPVGIDVKPDKVVATGTDSL